MLGLHYQNVTVEDESQRILDILHKLEHFILLFIYFRGRQYVKFKASVYHKCECIMCRPYFEINIS